MGDQPLPLFACSLNTLDCDLQGRKTNCRNSKTLVSTDRPFLALPLTCPNVKNHLIKNEKETEAKKTGNKKMKRNARKKNKKDNEKKRKKKKKKKKRKKKKKNKKI